jgi:uncharacterized protein (DUF2062 family)
MPKRIFKKIAPHPDKIKNHKSLRFINHLLHDPNIWHFNRRSVPKAFMIGIFCAFLPVPFQMLIAAVCSLLLSANISLSVILVWITNPLTMGPIFYACYKLGTYILNTSEFNVNSEWSISFIYEQIFIIWKPLWLGSLIIGSILSILSFYLIKLLWYLVVLNRIRFR